MRGNSRQEINRQILNILLEANEEMSDMRFHQLLAALRVTVPDTDMQGAVLGIRDEFYTESWSTLDRILNAYNQLKNSNRAVSE